MVQKAQKCAYVIYEWSLKIIRFNREHHARQSSLQANLIDVFMRDTHSSDPKILKILEESNAKEKSELILSPEVFDMLEFKSNEFVESDSSDSDSN